MQQPPNYLLQALSQHTGIFLMIGALAVGKALLPLFKPKFKGSVGEWIVNRGALTGLDPNDYRSFKGLYVTRHDEDGLTQIDHVVVSRFGIFVIETKNYDGWIFGRQKDPTWTQCLKGGRKQQFQNPLRQNWLHVQSLAKELGLPVSVFHSVVYFAGDATFKTPMPANVMNSGLRTYIKGKQEVLISGDDVIRVNAHLGHLITQTDKRKASREHLAGIRRRAA